LNNTRIFDSGIGYEQAMALAKSHYENFPVVSLLVPKELRKHLAVIYWFARTADDYADEGIDSSAERLKNLLNFENRLKLVLGGTFSSGLDSALHETIKTKSLSPENFFRLLKAFKQDVTKHRYSDLNEVLDYCSNSANPVGRLVLELTGYANDETFVYSDKICTALQITNFIQDTVKDYEKGRIYYPRDEMQKFGVTEKMFEFKQNNLNFKRLIEFSVGRVLEMFAQGKPLLNLLKGRIRYEIGWTIAGGAAILNKIRKNDYNVFNSRVILSKTDYFRLFVKSFFFK